MQVFKTYVTYGGAIHLTDTIEHDGKLWLVPHWLDTIDGRWTSPARIIRIDLLRHSRFGASEYLLNDPLPKELFDERSPKEPIAGYEVVELPEIQFATPKKSNKPGH
jgi:hypothetical protein